MAFILLKNVLGTGPKTKYGSLSGKLGKAVEKIEGQKAVGGFNFSYRDTGLTGALITCESGIAGHVSTINILFIWSFKYRSGNYSVFNTPPKNQLNFPPSLCPSI